MMHSETNTGHSTDTTIEAIRVPLLVKLAAASSAASGFVVLVLSLQLWLLGPREWLVVVPVLFSLLGLGQLASAFYMGIGRQWAAIAATVLAGGGLLFASGWVIYSFLIGLYSLLAVGTPGLLFVSLPLALLSLEPTHRISRARRQLMREGLNLGL